MLTTRDRIFVMKFLVTFLKIKEKTKVSVLTEDQKKTIAIGKEQFQKLVKYNLAVPVALL